MNPRDKSTSPKDMLRNKHVFSREGVAEMERLVRCIIPPRVTLSQRWYVVQHKKISQTLSRTQKMRMQRQREGDKRYLINVPDKTLLEKTMEL